MAEQPVNILPPVSEHNHFNYSSCCGDRRKWVDVRDILKRESTESGDQMRRETQALQPVNVYVWFLPATTLDMLPKLSELQLPYPTMTPTPTPHKGTVKYRVSGHRQNSLRVTGTQYYSINVSSLSPWPLLIYTLTRTESSVRTRITFISTWYLVPQVTGTNNGHGQVTELTAGKDCVSFQLTDFNKLSVRISLESVPILLQLSKW